MSGTLKLILDNITEDYEAAKQKIRERGPEIAKELKIYTTRILLAFLATFLVTVPILLAGIYTESKTLIVIAGIIRALVTVAFLILLAPVLILIEALKEKAPGSIKRYIDFVRGIFVGELVITAFAAWLPLKNNPDMIAMFLLLSALIGFLGSKVVTKKITTVAVVALMILTIASFYAPYQMQSLQLGVRGCDWKASVPERVDQNMTCNGYVSGDYIFFVDEKPVFYYYFNPKTKDIEAFKLKSSNKTHPGNGSTLKPMDREIAEALGKQICARDMAQKPPENPQPIPFPPNPEPQPIPSPENPDIKPQKEPSIGQPESAPPPGPEPGRSAQTESPRSIAAPIVKEDNRKLYAVIAVDENYNEDRANGEKMVGWLGNDRAIYAYDHAEIKISGTDPSLETRIKLAKMAKKIVFVHYKTRLEHDDGIQKHCRSFLSVKIIDADSGRKLQEMPKTFTGISVTVKDASQIALDFAFKAVKKEFENRM